MDLPVHVWPVSIVEAGWRTDAESFWTSGKMKLGSFKGDKMHVEKLSSEFSVVGRRIVA